MALNFEELLAKARAKKAALEIANGTAQTVPTTNHTPISTAIVEISQPSKIEWNEQQLAAINLAKAGASFVLMGAAGTGKTTTVKQVLKELISSGLIGYIQEPTKCLKVGNPAIVFDAFTNRAVRRIASQLEAHQQTLCHTIHSLIEFQPVTEEVVDDEGNTVFHENGDVKYRKVFRPARHAANPLSELQYVVIDESSMVEVELYNLLEAACPNAKFIFIGDLNQIPPVYGHPILGFKALELPTVELTQVYRQALNSPILALAHEILATKPINMARQAELAALSTDTTSLTWRYWKKRCSWSIALEGAKRAFEAELKSGSYSPDEDIILCPFNKKGTFGTVELNALIGQMLADKTNATVHEVIAGFETHYFAVGDKILYQSRYEGYITGIKPNPKYVGKQPKTASNQLDRWGNYKDADEDALFGDNSIQNMLDIVNVQVAMSDASNDSEEKRVEAASHIIECSVWIGDEPETVYVSAASEINKLIFGWAISIHKSQGSEWRKVYLMLHNSHAVMLSRELMYTAVTRAKNHLVIFCEQASNKLATDSTFHKAPVSQKIKGRTLAEKLKYFQGKAETQQTKRVFAKQPASLAETLNSEVDELVDFE